MYKLDDIRPYIDSLLGASNLTENQAKTMVYYCIMTWSDKPSKRPLLILEGESGTGKNNLMETMYPWCRHVKPKQGGQDRGEWIKADGITEAQLRDQTADTLTVFVEEGDKAKTPELSELWYKVRYDETAKSMQYNRQTINKWQKNINQQEIRCHFGYTVMHTQNQLGSVEIDRRTLKISIPKDSTRRYRVTPVPVGDLFVTIACDGKEGVQWERDVDQLVIEQVGGGSAWDLWLPLVHIADYLYDGDFLMYAMQQIELKTQEDNLSKVFEPKGMILGEVLEGCAADVWPLRVPVTNIREALHKRGCYQNEKQVVKSAKELGFELYYPRNKAHIRVDSRHQLDAIEKKWGVNEPAGENATFPQPGQRLL